MLRSMKLILSGFILFFSLTAHADNILNSLFHSPNDPVAGNPKGKVTVVEFFDYQCGHCINMASAIQDLIKQNPDVRVVFKEYPIRGPMSEVASRAALAANMQGKYYPFSHALLTADTELTDAIIFKIAKSKGLDVNKLKKDMDNPSVNAILKQNYSLAKELGIAGTPAFFIGNTNAQNTEDVNFVLGEMSPKEIKEGLMKASGK